MGCGCGCGSSSKDDREETGEVVMVPCKYCSTLFQQTDTFCPHCGARRTA